MIRTNRIILQKEKKHMSRTLRIVFVAVVASTAVLGVSVRPASAQTIFSKLGGVCLNVRGGVAQGAEIIGWNCSGESNEKFVADGSWLRLQGTNYCAGVNSLAQGSPLVLQTCNGNFNTQNFAFSGTLIRHHTGYCVDLEGGGWWGGNGSNQRAILFPCDASKNNQTWYRGGTPTASVSSRTLARGTVLAIAGKPGSWTWNGVSAVPLVASGGGNLVASGGGNLVASGGGNLVASGGGNLTGRYEPGADRSSTRK